jgi:hypothetical protein
MNDMKIDSYSRQTKKSPYGSQIPRIPILSQIPIISAPVPPIVVTTTTTTTTKSTVSDEDDDDEEEDLQSDWNVRFQSVIKTIRQFSPSTPLRGLEFSKNFLVIVIRSY